MDTEEFKKQIGYEGAWDETEPEGDATVDLTVTNNTPKEGAMTTNEATVEFEVYEVNGIKCVDRNTAMAIIGFQYPNELKQYVDKKKVIVVGEVQAKGKVNKKVFSLESVMKAKAMHKVRGSDAEERFEIAIHENVLEAAIADVERMNSEEEYTNVKVLIKALKNAENLTERRRIYNANKKA